jgi:hypothetical protein
MSTKNRTYNPNTAHRTYDLFDVAKRAAVMLILVVAGMWAYANFGPVVEKLELISNTSTEQVSQVEQLMQETTR